MRTAHDQPPADSGPEVQLSKQLSWPSCISDAAADATALCSRVRCGRAAAQPFARLIKRRAPCLASGCELANWSRAETQQVFSRSQMSFNCATFSRRVLLP